MNRRKLTDEERRLKRNEASLKYYYAKRKAMAERSQPVGVKNRKRQAASAAGQRCLVESAEKAVRKFTKTASGIKPMLKAAADLLDEAYRSNDAHIVEKVRHTLEKNLGIEFEPASGSPDRVCAHIGAKSKTVRVPAEFHQSEQPQGENSEAERRDSVSDSSDEENSELNEIPVNPAVLSKIESGEINESEIDSYGMDSDDEYNLDDEDEDDEDEDMVDDEDEIEDDENNEDDQNYDSEEYGQNDGNDVGFGNYGGRARSGGNDYDSGRWEMLREMDAQGAFDD